MVTRPLERKRASGARMVLIFAAENASSTVLTWSIRSKQPDARLTGFNHIPGPLQEAMLHRRHAEISSRQGMVVQAAIRRGKFAPSYVGSDNFSTCPGPLDFVKLHPLRGLILFIGW